jgi:hypothetical protein
MITRLMQALAGGLALLLAAGCTTPIEAVTDFNHRYDFSQVRRIALQPVDRSGVSAIEVSDMQVERVNRALADELTRRGFEMVPADSQADLLMTWHLVTEERTDVRTYNTQSFYNCWRCGPAVSDVSVRQFTQGTLIVDMVDPVSNRSVWRSIVQTRLRQSDAEQAEALRNEAARASFAQFPPP